MTKCRKCDKEIPDSPIVFKSINSDAEWCIECAFEGLSKAVKGGETSRLCSDKDKPNVLDKPPRKSLLYKRCKKIRKLKPKAPKGDDAR